MRSRLSFIPILFLYSCSPKSATMTIPKDIHSFSNPQQIAVRHLALDLSVLFDRRSLQGTATLTVEHHDSNADKLILDTRDLQIDEVESSKDGSRYAEAPFEIGQADAILGRALSIRLPHDAKFVRIRYSSSPSASGLQWLTPEQTKGKQHPYLFSQSEAIHARSWIPIQDSPAVRITFNAHIHVSQGVSVVMAAETTSQNGGDFNFHMNEAVPSYLVAIAAGDIVFQPTGTRTGVFAEPSVVALAAKEFEDTEHMLEAAEKLFGPYRWGRYDILVLPPSFPFGGMENPRVTFATPTVLAGDKSLVSLISHEMAHSWSGNLVTNATWSDFWLNEGFTTYFERRIVEEVYGREREEMEAVLGRQELEAELKSLPAKDTILHVDLTGRDPDEGMTQVPYEKGALFLRSLEEKFGRQKFDLFLKGYFDHFAFQSITTAQAVEYMKKNLSPDIDFNAWIYQPGLPPNAPNPKSQLFSKVDIDAGEFINANKLPSSTQAWSTQEWLHFLRALPVHLTRSQMSDLDRTFSLTASRNDEILQQWLLMSVRNSYDPANARLEAFLIEIGRLKYIRPIYQELAKSPEGKKRAQDIYEKARPGYHPLSQSTVDGILK